MIHTYPYFPATDILPTTTTSTPPHPDENWEDPVVRNKAYLKRITNKKGYIQEEFKGLNEESIYLFEVFVEEVELKNTVIPNIETHNTISSDFTVHVKLLHLPFMDIKEHQTLNQLEQRDDLNSKFCELNNLLGSIFSVSGHHMLIQTELDSEKAHIKEDIYQAQTVEDKSERKVGAKNKRKESAKVKRNIKITDRVEETQKDITIVKIMKGKGALFTMTGAAMIQILQSQLVTVNVIYNDAKNNEENILGATIASTLVRVPENFSISVLRASQEDTVLPNLAVKSEKCNLLDAQNQEVGSVQLTIALSSLGKVIVNSIQKSGDDKYEFKHAQLLRSLKDDTFSNEQLVNPEFAAKVIDIGLPKIKSETSSEIIRRCLTKKLFGVDSDIFMENTGKISCEWFKMVKKSQDDKIKDIKCKETNNKNKTLDIQRLLNSKELDTNELYIRPNVHKWRSENWNTIENTGSEFETKEDFEVEANEVEVELKLMEFKKTCRELKRNDGVKRINSIYERLEKLRIEAQNNTFKNTLLQNVDDTGKEDRRKSSDSKHSKKSKRKSSIKANN